MDGSGPKVRPCFSLAMPRRWSRTQPGCTRATRRSGSISRMWWRYFEKSISTAVLQPWPARLVPAAAQDDRRPVLAADAVDLDELVHVARDDDADRRHPVVRGVGRVEGAAAGVEPDLALDRGARGRSAMPRRSTVSSLPASRGSACHLGELHAEASGVPVLELEPVARPRAVGPQDAALRLGNAVEHHPLDPDVVVEVLEVPPPLDGAERMRRDRGRAVGGDVDRVRVREAGGARGGP